MRISLASIVLPPTDEHCFAGLCAQKACCDLEVRVAGVDRDAEGEEVYVLPVCDAHALNIMPSLLEMARKLYPADEVEAPPWEQDEKWSPDPRSHPDWFGDDTNV